MAVVTNPGPRLMSVPIDLYWAGWRTTTAELARNGWDISVREDYMRDAFQMVMQFKHGRGNTIYGMTSAIPYRELVHAEAHMLQQMIGPLMVRLCTELRIEVHTTSLEEWTFQPAEAAYPSLVEREIRSIKDLKLFKTIPQQKEIQEVIIDEPTLDEILELALEKQSPKQAEIRERMLKAEEYGAKLDSDYRAALRVA